MSFCQSGLQGMQSGSVRPPVVPLRDLPNQVIIKHQNCQPQGSRNFKTSSRHGFLTLTGSVQLSPHPINH